MKTAGVPDHYFSPEPASPADLRPLQVTLAGREVTVQTARGVFSPDHVDQGTAVLLRHAPTPPATGDLLDLGSGWGPVALTLALASPGARVWGVDVNERALDLLRRNAQAVGAQQVTAAAPDEVPDDIRFAAIWSNPPIRVGKAALHDMLLRWLPRLASRASAHLVVQRNLGSDSLQVWLTEQLAPQGFTIERRTSQKGFRVIEVVAP